MITVKQAVLLGSLIIALSGCASTGLQSSIPDGVKVAPPNDIQYSEVATDIEGAIGSKVRWGGEILKRQRLGESGWRLTVIEHPITEAGRPDQVDSKRYSSRKAGRFIVEIDDAADLKRVARNNFITLSGQITGSDKLDYRKKTVDIPVVSADEAYVWRNSRDFYHFNRYYFDHVYYHRWADPFWYHRVHTIHLPRHHYYFKKNL
jgi:starvation-inducible outer membrane lipoprotein